MALLARFGTTSGPASKSAAPNPLTSDDDELACGGGKEDAVRLPPAKKSPCEKCLLEAKSASKKAAAKGGKAVESADAAASTGTAEEAAVPTATCRVRSHYLCRNCLVASVRGKIMKGLTSSAAYGHPLVLAVSGGAASMSALQVCFQLLDCGRRRRGITGVVAAHVDCSSLLPFHAHKYPGDSGEALFANTRKTVVRAALERGIPAAVLFPQSVFLGGGLKEKETSHGTALGVFVEAPSVPVPTVITPPPVTVTADDGTVTVTGTGGRAQFALPSSSRSTEQIEAAVEAMEAKLAELKACLTSSDPSASTPPRSEAAAHQRMLSLFAAAKSLDARSRLSDSIVDRTLVLGTAALGCGHLALCDTIDRTTVKLLTVTCEGGGDALPSLASPIDLRFAAPSPPSPPRSTAAVELASAGSTDSAPFPSPSSPSSSLLRVCFLGDASDEGLFASGTQEAATHDVRPAFPFHWYSALPPERPTDRKPVPVPSPLPDRANGGVIIVKPLHDCEALETALLARYERLETAFAPHLITMAPHRSSIGQATAELVGTLQSSFTNTVHAVTRTARKIDIAAALAVPAASSLLPTDVGLDIEARAKEKREGSSDRGGGGEAVERRDLFAGPRAVPRCALCSNQLPRGKKVKTLCYACKRAAAEEQMRAAIEEFLL